MREWGPGQGVLAFWRSPQSEAALASFHCLSHHCALHMSRKMILGLPDSLPRLVEAKFQAAKASSSLLFSPTELSIVRTSTGLPASVPHTKNAHRCSVPQPADMQRSSNCGTAPLWQRSPSPNSKRPRRRPKNTSILSTTLRQTCTSSTSPPHRQRTSSSSTSSPSSQATSSSRLRQTSSKHTCWSKMIWRRRTRV